MKRFLTITAGLILVVAMLSLLTGCGSDATSEAKEYMQAGDSMVSDIEGEAEKLMNDMSEAFYEVTDLESFTDAVDEVKSRTAELSENADEALAEYEKMEGLEDVENYKEYAELRIESGTIYKQMLQAIDSFLDRMLAEVESGAPDEEAINEIAQLFQEEMGTLSSQMEGIENAAEELKEEENL
ncbi:MAG: hypothetical protein ACOC78_02285 [Actinomycetota bacterium]